MKLEDVAKLLNKQVSEVEEMLKGNNPIEIDLGERNKKSTQDKFDLKLL